MSNSNLPAEISNIAKGLVASAREVHQGPAEGSFMKFTKAGEWVYGKEEQECEEEAQWVVNPQGFMHGWIAWGSKERGNPGQRAGEKMVPASEPLPLESELPDVNGDWSKQVSMQLMCITGYDKGTKCIYNTNSFGGKKFYTSVVNEVVKRIQSNDENIAPVILLESESYVHPAYGKVYQPECDFMDFYSLDKLQEVMEDCEGQHPSADPDDYEAEPEAPAKVAQKRESVAEEPQPEKKMRRSRRQRQR